MLLNEQSKNYHKKKIIHHALKELTKSLVAQKKQRI